ncbi:MULTISPECIES: NACHT domain-containing protein [unclassified Saccharothrix]|uniref:NACHT domain-containing protein n=1 Tax=unclassified Saccharothrix TaxID=2593673 RepID=UPI00307FCCD1
MASDKVLTYEGALRLLGKHDEKWIKRVDALLGGAILGAGVVALLGNPLAAPVVVFTALWGWVDQKNEAIRLVSQALTALPGRRRAVAHSERVEQMTAAHTVLVVSAYFEALREALGDDYELLELSEEDKANAALGGLAFLYTRDVPKPGAQRGFLENLDDVQAWQHRLHRDVIRSFGHLARPWEPRVARRLAEVPQKALERYHSHYLALAGEIPEFRVWAAVTESAATRAEVRSLRGELLAGPDSAMSRLERVLSDFVDARQVRTADLRDRVARANRAVLDEPILPKSTGARYGKHLVIPTIEQAFITPRYRFAVAGDESQPADDKWWSAQEQHDDLHIRLIAHLSSTEAATGPLLLLGHPGAGKSLLTKVLAGRLPASGYTVVRVPLRRVDGHSSVLTQVQQALNLVTNDRVAWSDLVDQSAETVRVVILDGLDELLQQTHTRLYGYLDAVAEFQRREAEQGHPVTVVVTSRTLACDRVGIAGGTTMIKLDDFDDGRIESWLTAWHSANAAGVAGGTTREFPLDVALHQRELTAQPLLLMMMALYVSNPGITMLDARLSSAELYHRLLEHFAEREAEKSPTRLEPGEVRAAMDDHLTRLSTAALGMFNRGRQDITARQLEEDLRALTRDRDSLDAGERVLGAFFFVYAAESRVSADADQHYEFLHATFGEYLVASRVVDELAEIARAAFSPRRGMQSPEDDVLFALLSHQTLAQLRPALTFATELAAALPPEEVDRVLAVLDALIERHRVRPPSRHFRDYLPGDDQVARLAAYSANLLLLRLAMSPESAHPIHRIAPGRDPHGSWRSMLALWRAGLSPSAWHATVSLLEPVGGSVRLHEAPLVGLHPSTQEARLSQDRTLERIHRFGEAFASSTFWATEGDNWWDITSSWLVHGAAYGRSDGLNTLLLTNVPRVEPEALDDVLLRMEMLLKLRARDTIREQAQALVEFLLGHAGLRRPCGFALASAVLAHPELLVTVPRLSDPKWFSEVGVAAVLRMGTNHTGRDAWLLGELLDGLKERLGAEAYDQVGPAEVEALRNAYMWPVAPLPLRAVHTEIVGRLTD